MSRYVRVPQEDGQVSIGITGAARTWQVKDHVVTARSRAEEADLLLRIPGARPATRRDLAARTPSTPADTGAGPTAELQGSAPTAPLDDPGAADPTQEVGPDGSHPRD